VKLTKTKDLTLPMGVLGLAATADGDRLYVPCMDGAVYECDPATGAATPLPDRHGSFASGCVLPGNETLISAGYDGQLLWHDLGTKRVFRRVQAHGFWSWKLAMSPDGRRVATCTGQYQVGSEDYKPAASPEPTVKVYDARTGDLVRVFDHGPPVQALAYSPDGRHVAAANLMGDVGVWDVDAGTQVTRFNTPDFTCWGQIKSPHYCSGVYGLTFSSDGTSLLCCGMGSMADPMAGNGKMTWQRWDWRASPARKVGQIRDGDGGAGLMETVSLVPGGGFLMAGRQAQGTWTTAVFADDGKLVASLDTKSRVSRAAFSPDGKTLYLAATVGQPKRNAAGKWPPFGRVHVVSVG
jgi:WD40 repeat protein